MPDERIPASDAGSGGEQELDLDSRLGREVQAAQDELDKKFARHIEDLEERAKSLSAKEAENPDEDLQRRLTEVELKARAAIEAERVRAEERARQSRREREDQRGLGVGLTVAYSIIGAPLLGAGLGWLLDRWMGTAFWLQVCTVSGAAVGVFGAVALLYRSERNQ